MGLVIRARKAFVRLRQRLVYAFVPARRGENVGVVELTLGGPHASYPADGCLWRAGELVALTGIESV